ncbi:hypothetical protein [Kaistella jeonii]|uniref:Uncharacterized protein n=1 Tax=Kaistella jeonii TaxID=266749 RepID=A0A0C1F0G1_9FLAO|nr:hypothetical protein [Kaistella jeonii]KIA85458.1 hypothetical protein OA86_14770 [Kaistella jeonii]SFC43629.1 hypothetical protein SAMN05421876_1238 [Kaistella jeonii]VEI96793.1 Uncharacterised protein [Kaistella jeonii]
MKENLKIASKIGGKTLLIWLTIFILGNIITFVVFLISIFENIEFAGGGHGNIFAFITGLLLNNFAAFLLIFGAPVFIFLYFSIANKISIQNAIYQLWKSKTGDYISDKIETITSELTDNKHWNNEITTEGILKARLLQATKSDPNMEKTVKLTTQIRSKLTT